MWSVLLLGAVILGGVESPGNSHPAVCAVTPLADLVVWRAPERGPPRGVALLAHGLNHAPERMAELAAELGRLGWATGLLALRGHGENHRGAPSRLAALAAVDADRWHAEAACAVGAARAAADAVGVPLALVGFSLGGLVFSELVATTEVRVERLVLLAPAIRPHRHVRAVRWLRPWPGFVLRSAAPEEVRANRDGTPIAAYEALFALIERLDSGVSARLNVPALLLVDEEDELVDADALREMIALRGLYHWRGVSVRKSAGAAPGAFHHLLTERGAVGEQTWREMIARVAAHLEVR